jgi:hypothetical protein
MHSYVFIYQAGIYVAECLLLKFLWNPSTAICGNERDVCCPILLSHFILA